MNWEAVIAIAELIGMIAVVATLIYVAIQVRQNSELIRQNMLATRASMTHESSVFYSRMSELIATDKTLANIFRRGCENEDLEPDEITRFEALLDVYFTHLEDADHLYNSGLYFDEDDDVDLVEYLAPSYRPFLDSRYGRAWWDRVVAASATPSYFAKMQRIIAGWDQDKP